MKLDIQFKNTDYCEFAVEFVTNKLDKLKRFKGEVPQVVSVLFFRKGHSYAATFHYRQGQRVVDAQALGDSFATVSEQGVKRIMSQLSKNVARSRARKRLTSFDSLDREDWKKAG